MPFYFVSLIRVKKRIFKLYSLNSRLLNKRPILQIRKISCTWIIVESIPNEHLKSIISYKRNSGAIYIISRRGLTRKYINNEDWVKERMIMGVLSEKPGRPIIMGQFNIHEEKLDDIYVKKFVDLLHEQELVQCTLLISQPIRTVGSSWLAHLR